MRDIRSTGRRITAALAAAVTVTGLSAGVARPAAAAPAPWHAVGWSDSATGTSINNAMFATNADIMRNDGLTGKGVGVALVDTGVAPVAGLTGGNVVNGPDLSFDSQDPAKRFVDGNGHGTHLAGIIAGRASGSFGGGVAPGAKLTSVKVGAASGAVDVSQVIAAIDWVVAHRNDDTANRIRVLTLSYGTDGVQSSLLDPLQFAVENAWRAGIVVVVASGNTGGNTPLVNPAANPYVLSVGALDLRGTSDMRDDQVTAFTNRGTTARRVDISVPGRTIISLRAPGSAIDTAYPAARVGTQLFKGSGTSQAAAMLAGNVALLLQQRPALTPDQVKALLKSGSQPVASTGTMDQGLRRLDVFAASYPTAPTTKQAWARGTGRGTLEGARGSVHVSDGAATLTGESTVWGRYDATAWSTASAAGTAWSGGSWMGHALTGTTWTTSGGMAAWSGRAWSGGTWSGRAWSGRAWSSVSWLGTTWS
ncbi:S8 family serine peptidase [Spirilliplanes yamanashiensis]|uniref:Peptidase S8/S53 domain-containing protein n=1 Tax=Spirilliplanes yamanashiensis TaxID=42233 RepID=A0A8J3Y5R3_9ACTN|nr:S8 family serine peptidase [Spirilliplanes yamanashiensis]MDP9819278.1 serine protease AprX [Spirilliplanes yamanashiensis]GIJ01899.1 hypothetical protein Sya03_12510 [Spirilliplanes yamanashiensis]